MLTDGFVVVFRIARSTREEGKHTGCGIGDAMPLAARYGQVNSNGFADHENSVLFFSGSTSFAQRPRCIDFAALPNA